jgi:hypothetical protein
VDGGDFFSLGSTRRRYWYVRDGGKVTSEHGFAQANPWSCPSRHGEEELEQGLPSSAAALGFSLLYSYHDGGGTGNRGDLGFWEAWRLMRHLYPGAVMNPEVHGWRGPQFGRHLRGVR